MAEQIATSGPGLGHEHKGVSLLQFGPRSWLDVPPPLPPLCPYASLMSSSLQPSFLPEPSRNIGPFSIIISGKTADRGVRKRVWFETKEVL